MPHCWKSISLYPGTVVIMILKLVWHYYLTISAPLCNLQMFNLYLNCIISLFSTVTYYWCCSCVEWHVWTRFTHFKVQGIKKLTPWSRVLLEKLRVCSASQEIPRILWNLKVHCVHKSLPPVPVLSQMNSIHIPKPYFPKIHINVVLPSMPRSS
jgi:hypothetical protein